MGAAFTAINGGAQTGASIVIAISGNTTEPVTASLSQGTWATLIITPVGGAARTISGSVVGPLVEFNSADRVAIDGLNTGGNALTIENTNTGAASTLRFVNDARALGIQNVTLLGASTSLTMGTVLIDAGIGGGGNDSIVISNTIITNSGANFPLNGVYSAGNVTAGQENSQVQFLGCQISNYFSAGSVTRGILANTGNTDWTISNCRFFQTASRTYTTGNIHTIIRMASGNNHVITGNTLGFATALGTGTYTMAGAVTTRLIGIDLAVGTATATSVQGNTITAINLATTSGAATTNGVLCGINVTTGSVNIGNIAGNIIGGASGTNLLVATPTSTQGAVVGIHISSTGAHLISGNIMGGFASQSPTAGIAGVVTGINISGSPSALSITNNVIGNTTADNMIAGVLGVTTGNSLASGISLSGTVTAATTVTGNTIQNLSSYGTGTTGYVRGIWTGFSGTGPITISNNTVANLSTTNANPTASNGQLGTLGIYLGVGTSPVINNNTITNVSNLNAGAVSTNVAGISHTNGSNTVISNNRVYGINNASTATSTTLPGLACGVFVRGGANNLAIFNNMISLGIGQTSNTSFVGVIVYSGGGTPTLTQVLHNTIYIGGTAASGAQPSMCVSRGNYSTSPVTFPMDVRNNILQNVRTGGTGLHLAIANNLGATASATGWPANASNNNVLNANPATVGFWTAAQTYAGWQTASAGDGASYTNATVTFVNSASDLHLNMGVTPNVIESNGQTIGSVLTDIDAQVRPGPSGSVNGGAAAPDLGADEFDGVRGDFTAPVITYAPLGVICTTGDRTLTATITDFTGVPTAGILQPRIYFRKNAGAWFSAQGTLGSGSGTNGTWNFNIVAATMGGLIAGDIVQYYVIAQDIVTPTFNIGSSPAAGLVATDVNTVTTAPTTPSSYPIGNTLSGTYTVGAAGNYPTLTAAVNAYNTNCIGGPIVFSLIDPTYSGSETFPIVVNANGTASAINTLTIKPAVGNTAAITGSANTALIKILGSYVTIDGSNNGTTTRDLTISNTSITTPGVLWFGSTGIVPITNSGIRNSILINGANTSSAVVLSDGATAGTAGYFNNITIQNNSVQRGYIGIYAITVVAVGNGSGTLITGNDLNTAGANSIRLVGVYAQGVDGATISNNNIGNIVNTTETANVNGIFIATGTVNANITGNNINTMSGSLTSPVGIRFASGVTAANSNISNNTISALTSSFSGNGPASGIQISGASGGITVERNNVYNIKSTSTSGYGSNGIQLSSSLTAANIRVANNFVSDVASYGFTAATENDNGYGMVVTAGGGYNIYHNTVNMTTSQTVNGLPAAFNVTSGVVTAGSIDLRNNIFVNNQTVGTDRYAIYSGAANTVFSNINYNDYFTTGPNLGFIGSARANLAAVQAGFGGNVNAVSIAPVFVGAPDLHLVPASNAGLNDLGVNIPSVTVDIDNAPRSVTPDMGADEFTPPACSGTPTAGTATVLPGTVCANLPTTLTLTGFTAASGISFQWQASILPGGPYSPIPGATTSTFTGVVPLPGTAFITCLVTCANGGATAVSNEVTLVINPVPTVTVSPTTASICNPGGTAVTLTASSTGGTGVVAYTWTPTTGLTPTIGSPVSALPTTTTSYVVTGTDAAGCLGTATAVVSVGNNITGLTATATPSTVCSGSNSQLLATGSVVGLANEYSFATSTGATLDPMTGSTTVLNPSNDDTPTAAPVAIGFPFVYEGVTYTQYSVSPDGWILLGPAVAANQFANAMTSATNAPKLSAYWDDLATGTDGNVKTLVTGSAPNRIFKVQWFITSPRNTTGPANGTFQAWLYEDGGRIEYRYGTLAASGSASGGLTGAISTNIHSLTFSNNTSSPTTANDLNAAAPASGRMYTYTPPSINWSWSPATFIAGQTTLANPLATAVTAPTTYTVVGTTSAGCTATTTVPVAVTPTVTPSVTITASPSNVICAGTSVTFTAVPTNGGTTPVYQWQKNGSPVGTNSDTYTDAGLTNGDLITCVLTTNALCPTVLTATSNTITITVNPLLTPSVTISANPGTTICAGTNVTFTAVPVNGGTTPAYQWKKNGSNVGANSDTYSDNALLNGDLITVELTSNAICATPPNATSNTLTMVVNPILTPSVTISANPGTSICAGTNVTFTALPVNGGLSPTYQWFKNGSPVGTNSDTYSDAGLVNSDVMTCQLSSSDACASPLSATSNSLTITVVTNTTPTVSIVANPGSTICPGTSATFTASATNSGLVPIYQWLLNGSNVGTNSTTYTNGSLTTGDVVTCVVTSSDPCALPLTATSNPITMTVADLVNPTAVCQNVGIALNGGGTASTTPAAVNNGSNDNCTSVGSLGLSLNTTTFNCAQLGSNTVVLTVTDGAGRTGTCSATVNVVDLIAPAITCPPSISLPSSPGLCGAPVSYPTPIGTDNCIPTTTQIGGLASGATFPVGSTTNTFRVTDAQGNQAVCGFNVTVTDAELPSITCPTNISVSNTVGQCAATVTYTAPVGTDNCTATTAQIAGLASGSSFPVGVTTNTFRATDAASNTATCSFTVTVNDAQLPGITCPANISVSNTVGQCAATVSYTAPVGTDNCAGATTTQTAGLASGASFPVGVTTNTFRATDAASNSATCAFTVTVNDTEIPTITCPVNISVSNTVGTCAATVTYSAPVGADNCAGVTSTQTVGLASGSSFPVGVTTNTFRATDAASNSATCSFTVTVADSELPSITCPPNANTINDAGLCGAVFVYTTPAGIDNCSATTAQTAGGVSGTSFAVGVTTNTFTATDGAGNTATCSFTVTVTDAEAPVWTACPANITVSTSTNSCDAVVSWTAPSSTDNCAVVNSSGTQTPGSTFTLGTTTVSYTADDAAGNIATCSFDITVNDSIAPTANCQNVTVNLDVNGNGSTTAVAVDNGSTDNCTVDTLVLSQTAFTCANAGANTVTLVVTDVTGNSSSCTAGVTVVAQAVTASATTPVIDCGFNVSCAGATDGTATVTGGGGCPGYTYLWSNGQTTATATGLGAGVATVTVTDAAGGTSVATVTLTEPTAVSATVVTTANSCFGDATGSADITAAGGNDCLGYTFLWSNGATTEDLTGVAAGSYTVTVTDANGCTGTQSVTVGSFAALNPTFTASGNFLTSTQTWTNYQWLLGGSSISGATANTHTALTSGVYSLSVTDANGCSAVSDTMSVVVVAISDPTLSDLGLSIYPNPARGEFKLRTESPIAQSLIVSISDMYGHRLVQQNLPSLGQEVAFDISDIAAGTYMVEVVSKQGQRSLFRLVVQ